MSRWTGSWLGDPSAAGTDAEESRDPGVRLGLPARGAGSVAPTGRRILAFAVDAVGSGLIAGLITRPDIYDDDSLSQQRIAAVAVLALVYVFFTAFVGQTPGMYLARLRIARLDDGGPLGPWRAVVRTALLVLLVPALIWDRDRRGLHDKAANAVVVRAR